MQFVRKILNGRDLANIIDLPLEMKNIALEVLILPINETDTVNHKVTSKEFFSDFENILNIPAQDINKEIDLLREELNRF